MPSATFQVGDLTAVIGDNSAEGEHRAGYNGVWELRHTQSVRSLFVPGIAGLNHEHIFSGKPADDSEIFFEPRNAPMSFQKLSESEAELHQPPTPTFFVESWTRFKFSAPHYLDMSYRCQAHQHVFERGYLGLFWASYLNAPTDKSMYFIGGSGGQKNLWTQLCTQRHNDESTVLHRDDKLELTFAPARKDALYKNLSPLRFDLSFFYGYFDELVWIVMFDRTEGIRFAHSPSGGGSNVQHKTANPAWDFQLIVPQPDVNQEYGFQARTILRPRCSRDEMIREYEKWKATL